MTQELRASSPESVAILATRKNNQWSYSQATDRISITSIIHLACHHLAIPCEEFKTDPVGRIVGQPADKLEETPSLKYGYTKTPTYWAAGLAEAHAATAAILFSGKAVGG
ncbi:hypothetical protein Ahu01nite_033550 [Winogradskya humida]|uniref:Uncharacterized protein n=1 Tax=Winogradskya humida TaxID=113566 RepID=A0ABQ3ZNU3_9ACTN|nr:hypothetical protein Ahu01nite_033550 [Actinoplanes humidus]